MKNLIFLLSFLLVLTSCKRAEPKPTNTEPDAPEVLVDDCYTKLGEAMESISFYSKKVDSLENLKQPQHNSAKYEKTIDSLKLANNKLGKELLHKKMIIENAKYYVNIVNKNKTQEKFLLGWMNRALTQ